MRYRILALLPLFAFTAATAVAADLPEELQESINEDGSGIISDYGNLHEGDDINWFWLADGVTLADHRCQVGTFKDVSDEAENDMDEVFTNDFPEILKDACSGGASAPLLTVDTAIYWAEEANMGKAWIPFAGGYLAQAGTGVEMLFKDESGQVVAKIRHAARQGGDQEDAAEEVADDIGDFIEAH